MRIKTCYLILQTFLLCMKGARGLWMSSDNKKCTREAMILLKMRRYTFHEDSGKSISEDTYVGGFVNGKRKHFGYMEFKNGDRYIGNWMNDMMDGEGVFYRKSKNANFYGLFKTNHASTGMLYKDETGRGCEIDFQSNLLDVHEDSFWNTAITLANNANTQADADAAYERFF